MQIMKCPYCGGDKIEKGLRLFDSNGVPVGFRLRKGVLSLVAQIHCDICIDCKSIVRHYIEEAVDNKWQK